VDIDSEHEAVDWLPVVLPDEGLVKLEEVVEDETSVVVGFCGELRETKAIVAIAIMTMTATAMTAVPIAILLRLKPIHWLKC
jgi:hypothetical protein